jgi:hypothetical protein
MTRTISRRVLLRLSSQADEADICGDVVVADNLTRQIEKYANEGKVRFDGGCYNYSKEELLEDLQDAFWDAAVRVFDYYDETPDSKLVQDVVDHSLNDFLVSLEEMMEEEVGVHEHPTPGEDKEEDAVDEDEHKFHFDKSELEEDDDEDEDEFEYTDDDDEDDDE